MLEYAYQRKVEISMKSNHYLFDIKASLESNGWIYDTMVDDNVKARSNGKKYTINEHIRALIFALLSNRTPWKRIKSKTIIVIDINVCNHYNLCDWSIGMHSFGSL